MMPVEGRNGAETTMKVPSRRTLGRLPAAGVGAGQPPSAVGQGPLVPLVIVGVTGTVLSIAPFKAYHRHLEVSRTEGAPSG
jgi:hypothetical protein